MHRRAVLGGVAAVVLLGAGCLDEDSPGTGSGSGSTATASPDRTESETAVYSGTDRPPTGELEVYTARNRPANATVLDAERSGILANEFLADALSKASGDYVAPGGDASAGEDMLARTSGEEIASQDDGIRESIGYNERTSVAYENETYALTYLVIEC